MTIEMTTNWFPIIQPGLYGTILGDIFNDVAVEYENDFKTQLCFEAQSIMNEIFSEDWFVRVFGNVIASNVSFHSPQWYNFENDRLEFEMEFNEQKLFDYWETFEEWNKNDFFKWTEKNYGSRPGFISFFPYKRDDFEYDLCTIKGNYKFEMAVAMLLMYALDKSKCALDSYQKDFEENMAEYCYDNDLYETD